MPQGGEGVKPARTGVVCHFAGSMPPIVGAANSRTAANTGRQDPPASCRPDGGPEAPDEAATPRDGYAPEIRVTTPRSVSLLVAPREALAGKVGAEGQGIEDRPRRRQLRGPEDGPAPHDILGAAGPGLRGVGRRGRVG